MNVECQTIRVPTGVQDYRPGAVRRHRRDRAAASTASAASRSTSTRASSNGASCSPTPARRGNSGTNNWEITKRHIDGDRHIFDCFERIRDTAVAMRAALERGDWDEVGRQIAVEWDNRKRLAPGVTTPTIDDLIARATAAGATAAKVCGAGGGGCLFCYGPPRARRGDRRGARRRRRARARLPHRDGRPAAWITPAIARILREIADLLEIKDDNPFKIRAYRNGADIVANHPHELARARRRRPARDPRHRQGSRGAHPRDRRDRRRRVPSRAASPSSRRRSSTCCTCRASGPKTVATLYRELGIRTLDDLEQRGDRRPHPRAARAWARRRKR